MHRLVSNRPGFYNVNLKKEFIRNGIITLDDVNRCFEFAFGMTFGGQGAHRNHRSGGQARRPLGEIFINTFQGKLAEFALYNYAVRVGQFKLDPPDTEMMELTKWDSFDMEIEGLIISVKSTKRRGNLLLLETKDWSSDGRYIPNSESGCERYDYFVLARVDPDGEKVMRERGLISLEDVDENILREAVLSERWRVNLTGYITGEELMDDVISAGQILPQNSVLNGSTRMDAENYYVQSGDMHEIEELIAEIRDRKSTNKP